MDLPNKFCNICIFQNVEGESSESVLLNSSQSDRWMLGWTDTNSKRRELNNGGTVSRRRCHRPPPYSIRPFAPPPILTVGGITTDPSFYWKMMLAKTGPQLLLLNSRTHRKHTAALTPWMLQGGSWKGNMLLMFFVRFVFLFGIFCSELRIYINVIKMILY